MDFITKPTGYAGPNLSLDPLMSEAESRADMERGETATEAPASPFSEAEPLGLDAVNPAGDGHEGMGFQEYVEDAESMEFPVETDVGNAEFPELF